MVYLKDQYSRIRCAKAARIRDSENAKATLSEMLAAWLQESLEAAVGAPGSILWPQKLDAAVAASWSVAGASCGSCGSISRNSITRENTGSICFNFFKIVIFEKYELLKR